MIPVVVEADQHESLRRPIVGVSTNPMKAFPLRSDRARERERKLCSTAGVHLESPAADSVADVADKAGLYEKIRRTFHHTDALLVRMPETQTRWAHMAFWTRRVRKYSLLGRITVNRFVPRQLK